MLILVVLLQAAFSAFQDWSSSKVMKSIKNMMPSTAIVIRNGVERKVPVQELVVGDLVHLTYGTKVPADIRLIESHDLKFDKSMLTGESEAIEGTVECTSDRYLESKNMAFMTTLVTNGQGCGIVVAVGDQTIIGSIASLTSRTEETETSLHKELRKFVLVIAIAAICTASVVILVWSFWLRIKYPNYIDNASILVNSIAVIIAFIPEGLPVCITLSLLMSRVLVKNLPTIETLSCVNVICSDKTGTLTQNKMFVANATYGVNKFDFDAKLSSEESSLCMGVKKLTAAAYLCNNAHYDENDQCNNLNIRRAFGDATDIALLRFSETYSQTKNLKDNYTELQEIPFNSKNKWMVKLLKPKNSQIHESIFGRVGADITSDNFLLIKGAPDILLKKCAFINQADEEVSLTKDMIEEITRLQNNWSELGQRVILLCKKQFQEKESLNTVHLSDCELTRIVNETNDFCLIGMLSIIDPPREGKSLHFF
jgi:sodium/potassium-transporting ATPase subunit alpha